MSLLSENLTAYQTVREPTDAQRLLLDAGGTVVARREGGEAVWMIYLPRDPR